MIKIENVSVFGWEATIRGMRNPMNSWNKSDTVFDGDKWCMGENDLNLMKTLSKAGNDHGKFLRMIHVQMDVTAPLYWWKEADQYKVGTVTNSCSTMHKIHAKEFMLNDFSHEHLISDCIEHLEETIAMLNQCREVYVNWDLIPKQIIDPQIQSKKDVWWQMIQLLPSSYNQKRTWDLNYVVLKAIYHARKDHKLDEWRQLCKWIETLPYADDLIVEW